MTNLRHAALIAAIMGFLTVQAHASEGGFSQKDLNILFDDSDKPTQLMALSQQEMEKTEGAVWWLLYYAPAASAVAWNMYQTSAYMPLYHLGLAGRAAGRWIIDAVSIDKDQDLYP